MPLKLRLDKRNKSKSPRGRGVGTGLGLHRPWVESPATLKKSRHMIMMCNKYNKARKTVVFKKRSQDSSTVRSACGACGAGWIQDLIWPREKVSKLNFRARSRPNAIYFSLN